MLCAQSAHPGHPLTRMSRLLGKHGAPARGAVHRGGADSEKWKDTLHLIIVESVQRPRQKGAGLRCAAPVAWVLRARARAQASASAHVARGPPDCGRAAFSLRACAARRARAPSRLRARAPSRAPWAAARAPRQRPPRRDPRPWPPISASLRGTARLPRPRWHPSRAGRRVQASCPARALVQLVTAARPAAHQQRSRAGPRRMCTRGDHLHPR